MKATSHRQMVLKADTTIIKQDQSSWKGRPVQCAEVCKRYVDSIYWQCSLTCRQRHCVSRQRIRPQCGEQHCSLNNTFDFRRCFRFEESCHCKSKRSRGPDD
jgi:hypothetical protein